MRSDYCGYFSLHNPEIVNYQEFIHMGPLAASPSGAACTEAPNTLPDMKIFAIIAGFPGACDVSGILRPGATS
jgi:hypothetical protein